MENEQKQKIPKTCLYCEYWNGVREFLPDAVRAAQPRDALAPGSCPGQCENEDSIFFNQDREKSDSCRRFLKYREE